jgi:cellulose synthase/poly-beta-1,6-N-acetylglucosamine synthase-like glycosyltransferase
MATALTLFGGLLLAVAAILCVPAMVLLVQVIAGKRTLSKAVQSGYRPSVAVLMPAHNESAGIAAALATVMPQICPGDRILVVADNCSDDTAAVATACGAEVIAVLTCSAAVRATPWTSAFAISRQIRRNWC